MQWKTKLNKIKNIKKNSKIKRITEKKAVRETASFAGAIGKKSIAANSASIAFYVFISMIPLFIRGIIFSHLGEFKHKSTVTGYIT